MSQSSYSRQLLHYYIEHLQEERDHARWLYEDLTTHGITLVKPDEYAMSMIGVQYYMVFHLHPCSILGYMAVVEGVPTPLPEIERLEKIYGRKLFRFARYHAEKDQVHKIELFQKISETPQEYQMLIFNSAESTLRFISEAAKGWR
jgi:hypothetical protein